jgi:hypothetical protein
MASKTGLLRAVYGYMAEPFSIRPSRKLANIYINCDSKEIDVANL